MPGQVGSFRALLDLAKTLLLPKTSSLAFPTSEINHPFWVAGISSPKVLEPESLSSSFCSEYSSLSSLSSNSENGRDINEIDSESPNEATSLLENFNKAVEAIQEARRATFASVSSIASLSSMAATEDELLPITEIDQVVEATPAAAAPAIIIEAAQVQSVEAASVVVEVGSGIVACEIASEEQIKAIELIALEVEAVEAKAIEVKVDNVKTTAEVEAIEIKPVQAETARVEATEVEATEVKTDQVKALEATEIQPTNASKESIIKPVDTEVEALATSFEGLNIEKKELKKEEEVKVEAKRPKIANRAMFNLVATIKGNEKHNAAKVRKSGKVVKVAQPAPEFAIEKSEVIKEEIKVEESISPAEPAVEAVSAVEAVAVMHEISVPDDIAIEAVIEIKTPAAIEDIASPAEVEAEEQTITVIETVKAEIDTENVLGLEIDISPFFIELPVETDEESYNIPTIDVTPFWSVCEYDSAGFASVFATDKAKSETEVTASEIESSPFFIQLPVETGEESYNIPTIVVTPFWNVSEDSAKIVDNEDRPTAPRPDVSIPEIKTARVYTWMQPSEIDCATEVEPTKESIVIPIQASPMETHQDGAGAVKVTEDEVPMRVVIEDMLTIAAATIPTGFFIGFQLLFFIGGISGWCA